MIKKILLFLFLILPTTLFANSLVIVLKKYGETEMHITHLYVQQAGLTSTGDYIIRFENGQELSLGKPSDYEKFIVRYVSDNDRILSG
jgi:hypothetical protein